MMTMTMMMVIIMMMIVMVLIIVMMIVLFKAVRGVVLPEAAQLIRRSPAFWHHTHHTTPLHNPPLTVHTPHHYLHLQ